METTMETEMLLSSGSYKTAGYDAQSGRSVLVQSIYSTYPMSDLTSSQEHFTKSEMNRYVTKAKRLSMLTLGVTSAMSILSFILSRDSDSAAAYSFACDSLIAALASTIILWRFWSLKRLEKRDRKRELIALVILTTSLIVSGALIAYRAIGALVRTEKHKKSTTLLVLSSVAFVFYLVLFAIEYRLATRIGSRALRMDSMFALCGTILAFSIVITSTTRCFTTSAWFLDSAIALGVAVFSLVYGAYSVGQVIKMHKEYREFINGKCCLSDDQIVDQPHA